MVKRRFGTSDLRSLMPGHEGFRLKCAPLIITSVLLVSVQYVYTCQECNDVSNLLITIANQEQSSCPEIWKIGRRQGYVTIMEDASSISPDEPSSESDFTWLSEASDEDFIGEGHPFFEEVGPIVKITLEGYQAWRTCQSNEDANGNAPAASPDHSRALTRPNKRRRTKKGGNDDGEDEDQARGMRNQRAGGNGDDAEDRLHLACPYYKYDKFKHNRCLLYRLKRIKDVKQHLCLKHKQPQYCPVCGQEFETQTAQRSHTRLQECQGQEYPEPEGVTEDQRNALSERVDRKLPIDQQWFSVWDIMFAGAERPVSPWVEGPIYELLSNIREFWEEQGEEIITEHLQSRGQIPYDDMPSEERNLTALHRTVLRTIVEKLLDRYATALRNSQGAENNNIEAASSSDRATKRTGSSSDNDGAEVLPCNFENEQPDARFGSFTDANYLPFGDEGDMPVSYLDLDARWI
ncbi:hypothetical protein F5X96DRAFT_638611 [Biscogniauxia mediterranea]|nr:hypothetical protein F5X96DRAFT_638611 [Biscogniauxia mediterranea]